MKISTIIEKYEKYHKGYGTIDEEKQEIKCSMEMLIKNVQEL